MGKDTFIVYTSFYKPISFLSDKQLGRLFRAIFRYNLGEVVDVEDDIRMAFEFFKNQFEIDESKYQAKIMQNIESGRKGGNPNFKKGKPNPYYGGNGDISKDNQTLSKITKDNPPLSDITKDKPINDNVNVNANDVIADAITARVDGSSALNLEEIEEEINAAQAKAEGLCMSYGITPEEYGAIKAEIFAEWEMQGYSAVLSDAMNYFVNLMRIKAKDRQKQPKPPDIPLRDRQKALWNEIIGCGVQCPADTQKAFYAKWSETDASGRWMKCELENGFDVKRRLERYVINSDRQWR